MFPLGTKACRHLACQNGEVWKGATDIHDSPKREYWPFLIAHFLGTKYHVNHCKYFFSFPLKEL